MARFDGSISPSSGWIFRVWVCLIYVLVCFLRIAKLCPLVNKCNVSARIFLLEENVVVQRGKHTMCSVADGELSSDWSGKWKERRDSSYFWNRNEDMGEAAGWLAASHGGWFQLIFRGGLAVIAKENHLGIHEGKSYKGAIVLVDCGTRLMASSYPGRGSSYWKGLLTLHAVKYLRSRFLGRSWHKPRSFADLISYQGCTIEAHFPF